MSDPLEEFVQRWQSAMDESTFLSLTLADPLVKVRNTPTKQMVRPVLIQDEVKHQWEWRLDRQAKHKNLTPEESIEALRESIGQKYREAYLFTSEFDLSLRKSKQGLILKVRPPSRDDDGKPQPHDRIKNHLIKEGTRCAFLEELGVMSPNGKVKAAKQRKFRQINRYLELINDIYPQLPEQGVLRIVDFGCGLSYLTFALHHLLTKLRGRQVQMIGIDQNEKVIERCRQTARKLDLKGIEFSTSSIEAAAETEELHLAVSLHACDTATDAALTYSVKNKAQIILAAPCCQHELNANINCPDFNLITRHGILKERFSALATDALRVAALEMAGYQTQILEFIDLEHTPKNLLIRAVKQEGVQGDADGYAKLKSTLGVESLAVDQIFNQ